MRTCFLSIDVEPSYARLGRGFIDKHPLESIDKLDEILNIFRRYKAHATLFVTGEVLEYAPDLVKKWSKDFEIGCHNYQHISLDKINLAERERQVRDFVNLYRHIFGNSPKGFRAPRNIINNKQFSILERYGFLYDSSVLPRYAWPVRRYEGYKGRAPILPYWPDRNNYKKRGDIKILEIPESPITFLGLPLLNVPLAATWLRKWGAKIFKLILFSTKPKYINFNMHSWDGIEFKGESSKNSGRIFLRQLDAILEFLKENGYEFKSGEQIYGEFSKNK